MVSLRRDSRGNFIARKRLPDDVREEYGQRYRARHEAKFFARASVGRETATREFQAWQAWVEGNIAAIRAQQRGEGIDLSQKNAVALAGEWYTWFVEQHQNEPGEPGGHWDVALDDLVLEMRLHYAVHVDPEDPLKDEYGRTGKEIMRDPEVREKMRPVIADLGHTARFLAGRGLALTNKARDLFLDCVLLNAVPALLRLERHASGDYSPDELPKTFPLFTKDRTANAATGPSGRTPIELFEAWVSFRQPKHSTVESWRTVFRALAQQFQASPVTPDQAQSWIDGLITEKRTAFTVRNTWLRASKAVYAWAARRRIVPSNPFVGVMVEKHKRTQYRPKHLHEHEIKTILRAASVIGDCTRSPDVAARRWVPWLLAYTGARPSEITQLRGQDVKQIGDIWCLDLNPEAGAIKTDEARLVPIHPHLMEQGFLEFAKGRSGPLFHRPRRERQADVLNQKKSPAAQARQRLADWVREIGVKDPHLVRPLHAWRHTFKLRGDRAGIPEKALDRICGHAAATVGRGYGVPELKDLARAIEKFPRYEE